MAHNIIPVTQTTTVEAAKFNVEVLKIVLFLSATLCVDVYDHGFVKLNTYIMELKGEDYTRWANNDEYIYEYVAQQLGFTLAP